MYFEWDMGWRIVNNMILNSVLDYLELFEEYSIVELVVSKRMVGNMLIELDICVKYGINIVVIKCDWDIIVFF